MTYSKKGNSFNMTITKMKKWHHSLHKSIEANCIFCSGNMVKVANFLEENHGLEILDIGHAWVKIKAEKNYRVDHGGMTDESALLYDVISGKSNRTSPEQIREDKEVTLSVLQTKIAESTICPKCGSGLTLRQGKFGGFWGCTAFPACKYSRTALNIGT
jgi:hypothetical protein